MTTDTSTIDIKLVETNFLTRWPCTICGGCTEKVSVLAEGGLPDDAKLPSADPSNPVAVFMRPAPDTIIRVCETCLEAGKIDERLAQHASELEAQARAVHSLIGRLRVPSYEQWRAEIDRVERLCHVLRLAREVERSSGNIARSREALIDAFERHHPDLLPLTEQEIEAWLADAERRDKEVPVLPGEDFIDYLKRSEAIEKGREVPPN
jgi:hypothetical protein